VAGFEGGKQLGQTASISLTSISGVGDDAYYLAVGDQVGLIVKKGNAAFKVAVYAHIPVESKKAKEKTLAQQVVAGL
jgi:3-deoxy-D-manno-octulosonate 8-phosphate phosphatase KdsC-like HAD superfamily phosphatase